MLAAIATGQSRFENFSSGADCASTLACIRALGSRVVTQDDSVLIEGTGTQVCAPSRALDCGNSGSTMRMLSGILAAQPFTCELIGDESLSRRPMARIIAPLRQMGAEISGQNSDRPPLRITGGQLNGINYKMPVPSAQVKSCLLFAGLLARGETAVEEPVRTRDHTELALRAFGAEVQRNKSSVTVRGGQSLHAIQATVPGDISSAAFFLCAAAILPKSDLTIEELGLNPTRAQLLDVLAAMGARISAPKLEERHGELVGTVQVESGELRGVRISGALSAALIDELPVLAAIGPYTRDGILISDARELRVKESDRIAAVAENLRRMGAQVEETDDGLRVAGGQKLRGTEIDSSGDHRIAMAFAVAALAASGETTIKGADVARISFPEFFEILEAVAHR
jgi:3-phosphoshikimate 1-carboxyvinyltransferase